MSNLLTDQVCSQQPFVPNTTALTIANHIDRYREVENDVWSHAINLCANFYTLASAAVLLLSPSVKLTFKCRVQGTDATFPHQTKHEPLAQRLHHLLKITHKRLSVM